MHSLRQWLKNNTTTKLACRAFIPCTAGMLMIEYQTGCLMSRAEFTERQERKNPTAGAIKSRLYRTGGGARWELQLKRILHPDLVHLILSADIIDEHWIHFNSGAEQKLPGKVWFVEVQLFIYRHFSFKRNLEFLHLRWGGRLSIYNGLKFSSLPTIKDDFRVSDLEIRLLTLMRLRTPLKSKSNG